MWVWREETARGGWRLDAYGTWTWDEPARLEPVGTYPGAIRGGSREPLVHEQRGYEQRLLDDRIHSQRVAEQWARDSRAHESSARDRFAAQQRVRAEARQPAMSRLGDGFEPTPIFRSVMHGELAERHLPAAYADIPAPHPGSGPLPVQGGRRLAPVETVPPPPAEGFDDGLGPVASPEEELRRRAERRRRPRADGDSGRHVLRR